VYSRGDLRLEKDGNHRLAAARAAKLKIVAIKIQDRDLHWFEETR